MEKMCVACAILCPVLQLIQPAKAAVCGNEINGFAERNQWNCWTKPMDSLNDSNGIVVLFRQISFAKSAVLFAENDRLAARFHPTAFFLLTMSFPETGKQTGRKKRAGKGETARQCCTKDEKCAQRMGKCAVSFTFVLPCNEKSVPLHRFFQNTYIHYLLLYIWV